MAIDLELSVLRADQPALTVVGEVYRVPFSVDDEDPPVVSDVIARPGRSSRFALGPGQYSYQFHVEAGLGKFTVAVSAAGAGDGKSRDFDTKNGFAGRVYNFTVPA